MSVPLIKEKGNTLSEDVSVFGHVPDALMHHFVRGFFDGDGTVYRNKQGGLRFGFVGSLSFMAHLRKVIVSSTGISTPKLDESLKHAKLRWNGNGISERFKNWLYRDATIWLARKRNVFAS